MHNHFYDLAGTPWMTDENYAKYVDAEQYRFSPAVINEPQETSYGPLFWEAFKKGNANDLPTNLINRYEQIVAFQDGSNRTANTYGLWGQYYPGNSMDIIMNTYIPNGWMVEGILAAKRPPSLAATASTLQTITETAFTEIIMGANISRYDSYVQEWLRAGGQKLLDEMNELYPAN
jgi:putative aldouronate transport system substrate-binding protein